MNMDNSKILQSLSEVLSKYSWLLDAYVLDYYLCDHWAMLPSKWSECLEKLNLSDIPWILDSSLMKSPKCIFPLSFLSLRTLSNMVRLIRNKIYDEKMPFFKDQTPSTEKHVFTKNLCTTLDHILTRGIKFKKRHEIEQLCKLISRLMQKFDNNLDIIDFGSGKCHLSRTLSLCYGYRVFCIEANSEHINGALIREDKVLKALKKYKKFQVEPEEMPTKVNCFLTKNNEVDEVFGDKITRPHLLIGLHACGSLSNLIMEEFTKNPNSYCLVLACCCYMKSELFRFPMSQFLKENSSLKTLSIAAKELACHAIEKFLNEFSQKESESLKVHGYRACLEVLFEKYAPHRRYQSVKNVKVQDISFQEYVYKAIKGLDITIPEDVFRSDLIESYLSQVDQVVMFYSLRLLIAPIAELFILLDYKQYLREQSEIKETYLLPLFEPTISPRNFILIAHK